MHDTFQPPKPVVLEAEEEEEPEEEIVSDDSTHDPDFNAGTVSSDGDDDVIDDEDELDDAEDGLMLSCLILELPFSQNYWFTIVGLCYRGSSREEAR